MSALSTYQCMSCHVTFKRSDIQAQYRRERRRVVFGDIELRCACGGRIEVLPPVGEIMFFGHPTRDGADNVMITILRPGDPKPEVGLLPPSQLALQRSGGAFSWGYAGSGPAALAHSLLAWLYDEQTANRYYQQLKFTVIAGFPQDGDWRLSADQIIHWLDEWQADLDYMSSHTDHE